MSLKSFTPGNYCPRSKNVSICYICLLIFTVIATIHRNSVLELLRPAISEDDNDTGYQNRETRRLRNLKEANNQAAHITTDQTLKDASSLANLLEHRLGLNNDAYPIPYTDRCRFEANTKPCRDAGCPPLNKTTEERMQDLLSDQFRLSKRQLDAILSLGKTVPMSDVIIASAVSANHYEEVQAMFKALHEQVYPSLRNFTMVLFDLGLKRNQLHKTQKNCRCHVVSFNFDLFPEHVRDLHCYSWKPLIIRAMAERATTLIVWQDASVRWRDGFKTIFHRAAIYGQQLVVTDHADRVTSNTVPEMFSYMKEDICRYHDVPELANAMALHRPDPLVVHAIMEPWARCALEASCMCPVNYDVWAIRHCIKDGGNHRCHRFDQSALTLLSAKLYGKQRYKVEIPEEHKQAGVRVMRGDRALNYFRD